MRHADELAKNIEKYFLHIVSLKDEKLYLLRGKNPKASCLPAESLAKTISPAPGFPLIAAIAPEKTHGWPRNRAASRPFLRVISGYIIVDIIFKISSPDKISFPA